MKPQRQKNRHRPEEGLIGDCHRTCYACLLDLDRDSVPNFAEVGFDPTKEGGGNVKEFKGACKSWLAENGYAEFSIAFNCELEDILGYMAVVNPGQYYILGGESRTGVNHSVIAKDDAIVWDPSLNDSGIVGPCKPDGMYWITVLVPISQVSV